MTPLTVRIKVRCVSCRTAFRLNQEQYCALVKRSRVGLACPHCGSNFEYTPVVACTGEELAARQEKQKELRAPNLPPSAAIPEALPVPPREFPPPPFAPLIAGAPANNTTPPPFAPLAEKPFSPPPVAAFPQGVSAPKGNEVKKLTLNERWKKLPNWVQLSVIGVSVVILGVVIFAI